MATALAMLIFAPTAVAAPDQPRWKYFETHPLVDGADTDVRVIGCFPETAGAPLFFGCHRDLRSSASPEPWDESDDDDTSGTPTYTTIGDAANTALAADHPFHPGPEGLRPTSLTREYIAPWTDTWRNARCNPTVIGGGPNPPSGGGDVTGGANANDVNSSIIHLFATHNRLHDWSYEHGFVAERMEDGDQIIGEVQGDADGSDSPAFAARDAAYAGTTPADGTPPNHRFHLWRPKASLWYGPCVDGAFDVSVVAHAYAHAILDRMTAGDQTTAAGEGLADLLASEFVGGEPVIGAYVSGNVERGVRNYSMAASPLNFSDADAWDQTALDSVHPAGEILAAAGRDARAAIGATAWVDLLFASLPHLPAEATLLDARDALLTAGGSAHAGALWTAFARRGMGEGAATAGTVPSFTSPARSDESTVTFSAIDADTGAPVAAELFVGDYHEGATPVADASDAAFEMVDGTYDFVVRAPGYGIQRLTRTMPAASDVALDVALPRNMASTASGATGTGNGTGTALLLDDDEGTGWIAPGVAGNRVTVDLAGTEPVILDRANVSALVQSDEADTDRFTAVRWFELRACTASVANVNCTSTDAFDGAPIYGGGGEAADAFPGDAPRPVAPELNLRSFDVTNAFATHLRFTVLTNQCTGDTPFDDETLSQDPGISSDCTVGANETDDEVRAAELQVFGAPPEVTQTNTPKPVPTGGGDDGGGEDGSAPPPGAAPPGDAPAGPPAPPPIARDLTPPVLDGLRLGSRRVRRTRGTTIRFRLTEAARVTLTFARLRGRRFVRAARLRVNGRAGANRVRFRRRTLRPGRYRLTAVAVDAAGNRSQPRRVRFALLRR